ncbi:alpha/beta hydrolase [Streptomyces sp. H27-D2]|uniref:alpha/beta hydrolase n=1 Tax=Streptomyces sp. H27-D2 TaxID=3046304 RepID=UPI002DBCA9A7|nr:alpha/beta hydrolase [Streptomyces sp. H27-D2]MEC4016178.1 alpha/beta hydrolase [Streptomyces sp. H27-D2]
MTSFPELGSPSPESTLLRAALALAVVFVMLATTGWTAVRNHRPDSGPMASTVSSWQHATFRGHELPDPKAAPASLERFFDSLTAAQRLRLADKYPLVVGNLNGAPLKLRYRANHTALAQARAVERERVHDTGLTPIGRQTADNLVHRFTSLMRDGRQILAFDPTGSGRAAEVFGDLDTAERVSVVVPGVDTNVSNFERTERARIAPVGMAGALYGAERRTRPGTGTAVIAWADYTTPVGVGMGAATGQLAEAGSGRLRSLIEALPQQSRVALFCHSYGSVVCGVAARDLPDRVTDIAVAGSPGMRAETAAGLHTSARIWATRDSDDWIRDIPHLELGGLGHGADPVSAEFGARVVSAAGAVGHPGYFVPGTESLNNFARIGVGAIDSVSCSDRDRDCAADVA